MRRHQILPRRGVQSVKITTANPLPSGTLGSSYTLTFTATGGQGNYHWSLLQDYQGTGLVLSGAGVLFGNPAFAGTAYLLVQVADSGGQVVQMQFSLQLATATALSITTTTLPAATIGVAYTATLKAVGGATPYAWSLQSATPDSGSWISINASTGVLSGTPGMVETETVVVKVTDGVSHTATQSLSLKINPVPITITTLSPLPGAVKGSPYSTPLAATGGFPPYTWSLNSATPDTGAWINLNSSTGLISGTPGTAETETITVQVDDPVGDTGLKAFSLTVGSSGPSAIKFNPGHYTQSDFFLTTSPSTDGTFDDIDRMAAVVDGSGNPEFEGYMAQFHWADIEPTSQGSYSAAFISAINAVRARLQTNYTYNGVVHPFRLMIRIRVETQSGTTGLPAYIVTGISGLGADAIPDPSAGTTGHAPAFWRAPVMSAWINMLNHLGSLWDSDPYVEEIVALEETSMNYSPAPGDYSSAAFYTQIQNLITGLSSWPTTIKAINPNFGPTNTNQSWINTLMAFMSPQSAWAGGGPDVLTATGGVGETWGEQAFYGGSGSSGINYQGQMPCILGVEDDVFLWTNQTSAGDESYCFTTVHPTHIVWMIFPVSEYTGVGKPSQLWETGTVPALQAVNFRLAASALTRPANC